MEVFSVDVSVRTTSVCMMDASGKLKRDSCSVPSLSMQNED